MGYQKIESLCVSWWSWLLVVFIFSSSCSIDRKAVPRRWRIRVKLRLPSLFRNKKIISRTKPRRRSLSTGRSVFRCMTKKKKGWDKGTASKHAMLLCWPDERAIGDNKNERRFSQPPRMKKNLILLSRRSTGQISMLCSKTASAALGPIIHQGRIPADARFFLARRWKSIWRTSGGYSLKRGPLTQSWWKRRRSQWTSREELHEEGSPSAIKEGEIEEMISSILLSLPSNCRGGYHIPHAWLWWGAFQTPVGEEQLCSVQ